MTMRLAYDDIVIAHGSDAVRLHPSLRAAYRLNRKHGIGKLVQAVTEGHVTIIYDILAEGGGDAACAVLERKMQVHLGKALQQLQEPLFTFLAVSFGIDDDPATEHPAEARAKTGKPFDLEKALAEFFEIATGWLGWTPDTAWNATPAEILTAQRGLIAKLKAIHGSAEDKPEHDPREEITPEQAKQGIAKLRVNAQRGRPQ